MRIRALLLFLGSTAAVACGGNPVSSTPPPPNDPPKITCPAPVTVTSSAGQPIPVSYGSPTVALGQSPLTTTCTPVSGSSFSLGATTVTCSVVDALQRSDSCSFAVTVTAPPRISLTRFVAFGDSITWGEDGQNGTTSLSVSDLIRPAVQVATPYPNSLQVLLTARYSAQSITVVNAGCRGELAADVSSPCATTTGARFDTTVGGGIYQAVLIMEGSNDVNAQSDANGNVSYAIAAVANLQAEIDYAKSIHVRPYLATIPPMNSLAGVPARRGVGANYVPPYNQRLAALASSEGIDLVDVYGAIFSQPSWDSTLIGPDGLHPTQAGYNLIAQTFFTTLKNTLESTPTPTRTLAAPASVLPRKGSSATPVAAGPGSRAVVRRPR